MCIDFQKSNVSNSYYLEYCFMIKALHPKIERFHLKAVDFRARFAYYNENGDVKGDFELDLLSQPRVELALQQKITDQILPAFDLGVVIYLKDRPIMKLKSTLAIKEFLSSFESL